MDREGEGRGGKSPEGSYLQRPGTRLWGWGALPPLTEPPRAGQGGRRLVPDQPRPALYMHKHTDMDTWTQTHRDTTYRHMDTDTWTHTQLHPAWGCEATTLASALSKGLLIYFFEKPGTSSHPVSNPRGGPVHRRPGAVAVILGTSGTGGGRPSGSPLMSLVQGPDRSLAVAAEGSDLCRGSGPLSPMPPLDSRTSLHHPLEDSHPHGRLAGGGWLWTASAWGRPGHRLYGDCIRPHPAVSAAGTAEAEERGQVGCPKGQLSL